MSVIPIATYIIGQNIYDMYTNMRITKTNETTDHKVEVRK